jgi:hypothetical protein
MMNAMAKIITATMASICSPPATLWSLGSLAGLWQLALDLGIDTKVVQGPGQNGHGYGPCLGAVSGGSAVVIALASGNGADNEPDYE